MEIIIIVIIMSSRIAISTSTKEVLSTLYEILASPFALLALSKS